MGLYRSGVQSYQNSGNPTIPPGIGNGGGNGGGGGPIIPPNPPGGNNNNQGGNQLGDAPAAGLGGYGGLTGLKIFDSISACFRGLGQGYKLGRDSYQVPANPDGTPGKAGFIDSIAKFCAGITGALYGAKTGCLYGEKGLAGLEDTFGKLTTSNNNNNNNNQGGILPPSIPGGNPGSTFGLPVGFQSNDGSAFDSGNQGSFDTNGATRELKEVLLKTSEVVAANSSDQELLNLQSAMASFAGGSAGDLDGISTDLPFDGGTLLLAASN